MVKQSNKLVLNKFHQITKVGRGNLSSFQKIKKQVRDLRRLISHGKLSEEALAAKEQELVGLESQLGQEAKAKKVDEKKVAYFSRKYDRVKSVETKKLARRLRQVNKQIEVDDNAELQREKKELLVKLNYVKKYPKDQKYISVFKETVEHATKKKDSMMEKIALKTERFREKKYAMTEDKPSRRKQEKKDDFFTAEVAAETAPKKIVNKQGLVIA